MCGGRRLCVRSFIEGSNLFIAQLGEEEEKEEEEKDEEEEEEEGAKELHRKHR